MSRAWSTLLVLTMTALLQVSLQTGLRAEPVKFQSEYSVRLIGFPVAYASFITNVDGNNYKISGTLRTSALSDILSKTRGTANVSGRLSDDRLLASNFMVSYSSGNSAKKTEIEFRNGNVKSTVTTPKRPASGADWVPITDADLRAVLDPLSGLVFPGGSKVCHRSLPIFDGQSRVTLHLAPRGVRPFRTDGFAGGCDSLLGPVRTEGRLSQEFFGHPVSFRAQDDGSLVRQA